MRKTISTGPRIHNCILKIRSPHSSAQKPSKTHQNLRNLSRTLIRLAETVLARTRLQGRRKIIFLNVTKQGAVGFSGEGPEDALWAGIRGLMRF